MLYSMRAVGVILLILSPATMHIIGPQTGLLFLCVGFGLLLPDLIPDLDYGRGDSVPMMDYDNKSPSTIAWAIVAFVAIVWLAIGLLASLTLL